MPTCAYDMVTFRYLKLQLKRFQVIDRFIQHGHFVCLKNQATSSSISVIKYGETSKVTRANKHG
jgi:hypothetical protein